MSDPPKQLVDALKKAVAAVDEAEVPKDLREIAFKAALAGVKVDSRSHEGPLLSSPPSDLPAGGANGNQDPPTDQLSKIAAKLKCDLDPIRLVFDIDEDGAHLLVARASLDTKPAIAQQEIALLILAARQSAGIEEWTNAKIVRNAAHDLGAYEKNHSTYVGQLQGPRMRIRGKGQSRELKLNQPGFEAAATIVARLAGQ